MSISNRSETLDVALGSIERTFKNKIIDTYLELKHRAFKAVYNKEYDGVGISAGKFCETMLRFLQKIITGEYTPYSSPIENMGVELNKFEKSPKSSANESIRLIIPRTILLIYTLRNKRGIGHVGGDIEANSIDISTIVKLADWIIVELIRIYHTMSFEDAQALINSINSKEIPSIWEINGKKRVLQAGLDNKDKILLILYSDINNFCAVEDLFEWIEYSNISVFKNKLLKNMHSDNLIEYDTELEFVHLSPIGIQEVEQRILKSA
jgi:hypothetical protein